jgi:hypothetical protein
MPYGFLGFCEEEPELGSEEEGELLLPSEPLLVPPGESAPPVDAPGVIP